jgi:hypothetical protein
LRKVVVAKYEHDNVLAKVAFESSTAGDDSVSRRQENAKGAINQFDRIFKTKQGK